MRIFFSVILLVIMNSLVGCVEPIKPPPEPNWSHTIDLGAQRNQINQAVLREKN